MISRILLEISRFTVSSRFFVMLCKLSEQYSQTNFTIIKPFKVTKKKKKKEWQIFRPKWAKIKILSLFYLSY